MAANRISSGSAHKHGPAPVAGSARTLALRLLSRRDYTTSELRDRLLERGFPSADVEGVIADLTAGGTLNDDRVAATHARAAVTVKGRGRYRVKRELQARGVSDDVASAALSSIEETAEADAIAKILARKRFPARPAPDERRRMIQHLLRRGYPADLIYRCIGGRRGEPDDPSEES